MTNLLAQAINSDDADRAAKLIQDALGSMSARSANARGISRMRLGVLIISAALICFSGSASAHEAPSGWQYPPGCCGGEDCHPVACETIEEKRGVYIWKGVVFHRSMARVSGDDRCHVCLQFNGEGPASGRCLFLNFGT
jgi:hypothetical protein